MVPFSLTLNNLKRIFQGRDFIQGQINRKWYKNVLQLQTKSYIIYRTAPLFDAEYLRNGTRYRHSCNGTLTGTFTRCTGGCHFEWPWVNFSDLAKHSVTRSIAQPLCDSWASCDTNRPSSVISGHVTVDFYRTLVAADVHSVDAVWTFTGVVELSTVTWLIWNKWISSTDNH